MSITDIGKVCLFSSISGVITLNGKPATGAKLVRTADRDGAKTYETVTDESRFRYPENQKSWFMNKL